MFKYYKLKYLFLEYNELTEIPKEFGNLTNLNSVYLHNNKLTEIPKEFGNLTNLYHLSLSNNKLKKIPTEICDLKNLYSIELGENKLKKIPKEILKIKCSVLPISSYEIDNLDPECEFLIILDLRIPLLNLPITVKELYLINHIIDPDTLKIPFGCNVITKWMD